MFEASDHYSGVTAETYDDERADLPKWQREAEIVEQFLAAISPRSVLDAPVGTGRFIPLYATLGVSSVLGVDISEDMLARAAEVETGEQLTVELTVGDVTGLAVPDDAFDVAVCIRLLNLIPFSTVERAIPELARVSSRHLVLGVRTRPSWADVPNGHVVRVLAHRARGAVRARISGGRKVNRHREDELDDLLDRCRLSLVRREHVDTWRDGSRYFIYLLERAAEPDR